MKAFFFIIILAFTSWTYGDEICLSKAEIAKLWRSADHDLAVLANEYQYYSEDLPEILEKVLKDRVYKKILPPRIIIDREASIVEEAAFGKKWIKLVSKKKFPSVVSTVEKDFSHGNSRVLRVKIKGKIKFFRPITNENHLAPRREFLASSLNQAMKLKTVPHSELVEINGTIGLLSDTAKGITPGNSFGWMKYFAKESELSDAMAFEFLVGNGDAHAWNFHITANGEVPVFDHDMAFKRGILKNVPNGSSYSDPLGRLMPKKYTQNFIDQLKKIDESALKSLWGKNIMPDELDSVLLRREMILKDAELRGPAAIL